MRGKLSSEERKYRNEIKKISSMLERKLGAMPLRMADEAFEHHHGFSYKAHYRRLIDAPFVKELKSYKPIPVE